MDTPNMDKRIFRIFRKKDSLLACKKTIRALLNGTRTVLRTVFSPLSRLQGRSRNKCLIPYCVLAIVLLAASVVYSIYGARIFGWQQEIYVQSFSFTLNGNKTNTDNIGTINNEDETLNLIARGQEADLTLAVEAKGYAVSNFSVPYTIKLYFDSTTGAPNEELARAIEVYEYSANEYHYVSMLDEFVKQDSVTLSDNSVVNGMTISGKLGINEEQVHRYRLVYSPGAGDFYEGKTFSLVAEAAYTRPEYTGSEYFVYSQKDLKNAATTSADNVTLVLLKDVTLAEDLTFSRKVGLDLNGYTLACGSHSININYNDTYASDTPQSKLSIKDSAGGGTISGNGVFINAPNDLLLIDDAVHALDLSSLSVTAFSQGVVARYAQEQLSALCETPIPGTATTLDFTHGLKPYLTGTNPINVADTDVVLSVTDGVCAINPDLNAANTFTNIYRVQFSVYGTVISGDLTILGNNAYSVAQRVIANIPSTISSSVFLPTYDAQAKANLTWVSTNTAFLTNNGVFLPNGYESLPDWTNQNFDIGLIVEVNGERYAAVFVRECEILSPEERTRLIYDYASIVLDLDDPLTLTNEHLYELTEHLDATLLTKLGYASSKIVIDVADNTTANPNYTGTDATPWYADYAGTPVTVGDETRYTELEMLVKPTSIGALVIPSDLTFYYTNTSGSTGNFSVNRPVMLLGTNRITTLDDPTETLQQRFTNNEYLTGDGTYSFFADGSYNNGTALVEYEIPADSVWAQNDMIEVINGLFVEDAEGPFYRTAAGAFVLYEEGVTPAGTQRYDRRSLIIVKPENISMVTDTALIKARLLDNSAPASTTYQNSLYLDPLNVTGTVYQEIWGATPKSYILENDVPVEYDLSLVVEGIYHLRPAEIADGNLYALLCRYFDHNADNYISVSEAISDPIENTASTYTPNSGDAISYLSFRNAGIQNLKGIEYFVNITGLDFGNTSASTSSLNAITDISYLSVLEKLAYLNMADNSVTDITALQYLDNLIYINFENLYAAAPNNNITDLSAIQYLPAVQVLDLSHNDGIFDVEPIADYANLYYLDMHPSEGSTLLANIYNQYFFTLLYGNNSSHFSGGSTGVYYTPTNASPNAYVPTASELSAAYALANLTVVDETYNTLILKTSELYNGTPYYFEWISSSPYLDFSPTSYSTIPHQTSSFTITSPLVDAPAQIIIYVDSATASIDTIARRFNTNILQLSGVTNMSYLEGTDGKVHLASELIPDMTLRSLLYTSYNYAGADTSNPYYGTKTVYVDTDSGEIVSAAGTTTVAVPESNILSQDEIAYQYANVSNIGTLSYSDSGIQNLAGISHFAGAVDSLDLRGNVFAVDSTTGYPDISELSSLAGLTTLYLDSQSFDFTQLAHFSETAPLATDDWNATYTGTNAYGAGLTTLTNLSVYGSYELDQEDTLAALYQVYLMNKNASIYIDAAYGTAGATPWNPYEVPMARYLVSLPSTFDYVNLTGTSSFEKTGMYLDENGVRRLNVVKDANGYYCYEFYFYNTLHIKFHITEFENYVAGGTVSDVNLSGIIDGGVFYTGFDYHTLVGFTLPQFTNLGLDGNEGISFTQDADIGRNETVTGSHYVEQFLEFNHHLKLALEEGGEAYSLNELFPGRTLLAQIMSNYSPTLGIPVVNDAGTTIYLAGTPRGEDLIFTLGDNLMLVKNDRIFSVTGLFLSGGESAIQGLQYTNIRTLTFQREAILGDGTWLQNLTGLYIGFSAIDFSSLHMSLPNLRDLVVGKYYGENNVRNCWYINLYDSSEYQIADTSSELYQYIVGLKSDYTDSVYDEGTVVTSAYYDHNSLQKEAILGSAEDANVYNELRTIARSRDASGNFYFYLNYMPNLRTFNVSSTRNYDWTGLLGLLFNADASASNYDSNNLAAMSIYHLNTESAYNSNGGICEPIVRKLYQAYLAEHGTAPAYRIGAIDDNASDVLYDIDTWHSNTYLHDENYELYDPSRTLAREQTEFAGSVLDLGVKLGTTLHYQHASQEVAAGTIAYLPATTGNVMFGTEAAADFFRDFPITWKTSAGTAITGTPNAQGYYEYTLAANSDGTDKYDYFVGTMGGRSYYYPVLVDGTDAYTTTDYEYSASSYSYGIFEDLQLRLAMFLLSSKSATFDPTGYTGQITMSIATAGETGTMTLSSSASTVNLAATPNIAGFLCGVTTLNGMEIFTSLKNANFENLHITDASALGEITTLETVKLNNNLIGDISWMSTLSLTQIELENCPLRTAHTGTTSHFPAIVTKLLLSGCGSIAAEDIAAMNSLLALEELNIDNTKAATQEATIQALYNILAATGRTASGFTTKLTADGSITGLTTTALQAVMNFLNPATTTNAMFQKLLTATTGSRFQIGSTDTFPSETGVTFTVPNSNIYSSSAWSASIYSYCDFAMDVKFSTFAGVNFQNFAIKKTVYVNFADRVNTLPLRFYTNSANTTYTDISYSDLDHNLYMFLTTSTSTANWQHALNGSYTHIEFPYKESRALSISADFGITSLKGIDKIPNLQTVTVMKNFIDTLGFSTDNTSITSLTLGRTAMHESAFSTLAKLTALRTVNLTTVTGINYEKAISGTSTLADLLTALTNNSAALTIRINNEYNYILPTAGKAGIQSDARYTNNASGGLFGGKAISDFNTSSSNNFGVLDVWRWTSDTVWKSYNDRSHLSEAYTNHLWWNNDAYARVFLLNTLSKFGSGVYSNAWSSLIRYLSQISTDTSTILPLPDTIYYADYAGNDPALVRTSVSFKLPKTFSLFSTDRTVTWTAGKLIDPTDTSSATTPLPSLLTDNGTDWTLTFAQSDALALAFEDGDCIKITGTVAGGGTATHIFKIHRDASAEYYQRPVENTTYITNFYIEMEDGEIVLANQFFPSYRFLYWIYNHSVLSGVMQDSTSADITLDRVGASGYTGKYLTLPAGTKYLSYEKVLLVHRMQVRTNANETSNQGPGSAFFEGIQLFANLKNLSIYQGYLTSIEPLSNLQLTDFSYLNSNIANSNVIVQDWSPLYNSRNTLRNFVYARDTASVGAVYNEDFSFLMSFTNLQKIEIGMDTHPDNINQIPGFQYMLAWLYLNNSSCSVRFNGDLIYSAGSYSADAMLVETVNAAQLLKDFRATDYADILYENNFELAIKDSAVTAADGSVSARLPSIINHGGKLYPIEWVSMSSFISLDCHNANGDAITTAVNLTNPLSDTEDDIYFCADAKNYVWTLHLSDAEANYLGAARVIARIMTEDGIFERVFTINTAKEHSSPSLKLWENFGSYAAPTQASAFTQDPASASYYTILTNANSQSVLVLNPTAVGNDVYVNVGGVKTKVVFDQDTTWFTRLTNLHTSMMTDYANIATVDTDYDMEDLVTLQEKVNSYENIRIGEWIYMEYLYGADVEEMNAITAALKARLATLSNTNITIVYSGAGTNYVNAPENLMSWNASFGAVPLQAASKTGEAFVSWYTDSSYTQPISVLSPETLIPYFSTETVTLYARFFASASVSYTTTSLNAITNNPIGFTANNPTTFTPAASPLVLADPTGADTGYSFLGWYLDGDFTTQVTELTVDNFVSGTTVASSITLYARFRAPKTVSYVFTTGNGLTNPNNPVLFNAGSVLLQPLVISGTNYEGKVFTGWYTAQTGGEKVRYINDALFAGSDSVTLYAHFMDGYFYLALNTYNSVSKFASLASWPTGNFCYRMDSAAQKDKIQLNGVNASLNVFYSATDLGEWYVPSSTLPASLNTVSTVRWDGATNATYTNGTSYGTAISGTNTILRCGSYKFTFDYDETLSTGVIAAEFSMNGTTFESAYAGASSFTSADRNYRAPLDGSYVYGLWGAHQTNGYGTFAQVGVPQVRKISYDGSTYSTGTMNWASPNRYYTFLYLTTLADGRDIYVLRSSVTLTCKVWQGFSDIEYTGSSATYLDIDDMYNYNLPNYNTPVVRHSYNGGNCFGAYTLITSASTAANCGASAAGEFSNGLAAKEGNYTGTVAAGQWLFFCPQGYKRSTTSGDNIYSYLHKSSQSAYALGESSLNPGQAYTYFMQQVSII